MCWYSYGESQKDKGRSEWAWWKSNCLCHQRHHRVRPSCLAELSGDQKGFFSDNQLFQGFCFVHLLNCVSALSTKFEEWYQWGWRKQKINKADLRLWKNFSQTAIFIMMNAQFPQFFLNRTMKQIYHDLLQNHQAKLPHNQGQFQHCFSRQFHPEVKNSWNS